MPRSYSPEFRPKVLDLVVTGRAIAQIAQDLDISEQTIYTWRRQYLIDIGKLSGSTTSELSELAAARKKIAELETELAIYRCSTELLGKVVSPKAGTRLSK